MVKTLHCCRARSSERAYLQEGGDVSLAVEGSARQQAHRQMLLDGLLCQPRIGTGPVLPIQLKSQAGKRLPVVAHISCVMLRKIDRIVITTTFPHISASHIRDLNWTE